MITYINQSHIPRFTENLQSTQAADTVYPCINMPLGLIGFPDLHNFEILFDREELPFLHFQEVDKKQTSFIVIEPFGLIDNYEIEILDPDLEFLEIKKAEEVLVLNIASIQNNAYKQKVTVNLVGPIIINRNTFKAKQIVIGNYSKYSSHYILFQDEKNN